MERIVPVAIGNGRGIELAAVVIYSSLCDPWFSCLRAPANSIVAVLPEDSDLFFVNADHVLNCNGLATVVDIRSRLSSDQILSPHIQTTTDQIVDLP